MWGGEGDGKKYVNVWAIFEECIVESCQRNMRAKILSSTEFCIYHLIFDMYQSNLYYILIIFVDVGFHFKFIWFHHFSIIVFLCISRCFIDKVSFYWGGLKEISLTRLETVFNLVNFVIVKEVNLLCVDRTIPAQFNIKTFLL